MATLTVIEAWVGESEALLQQCPWTDKPLRALNCLACESLQYFGRTDGPEFLQVYFCDDPAYESLGNLNIAETEEDLSMNCDGTVELLQIIYN